MPLTSAQRKHLRGLAHALRPMVQIGHDGLTEGVVSAVDQGLADHELIKVRMHEPQDKRAMAAELARRSGAELCGLVGHTAIIYRRHPEEPKIELP